MAENYNDEIFSYTWDTQANYIKNFGDHSLNALAYSVSMNKSYKATISM